MSELIDIKLKDLQKQKAISKLWNMTYEQGIFLSNLIDMKKPKKVLEIGTSNGFSTLFLAKNLNEGSTIDTIEINEERFTLAKRNFEFCKLENIKQHLGDVFGILPALTSKYDFVVVDSVQSRYLELMDIFVSLDILEKEHILIFDNVISHNHNGNLDDFLKYMKDNYIVELLDLGKGFLFAKSRRF